MNGPARSLVVVPTYNERESIAEVIRLLLAAVDHSVDMLVVDDSSPDGTAEVVKACARELERVNLLVRPSKQGLAGAYVDGFTWGLERNYASLVEMDADLSHSPADVARLLARVGDADLVVGSRYVAGGGVRNWGLFRRMLSSGANHYARGLLRFGVRDSTSGLRAYRAECLKDLDLNSIHSEGYAFQVEMTRRVAMRGGRIVEIPITFVERARGRSKMSRAIFLEALVRVTKWGIEDRIFRRRTTSPPRAP